MLWAPDVYQISITAKNWKPKSFNLGVCLSKVLLHMTCYSTFRIIILHSMKWKINLFFNCVKFYDLFDFLSQSMFSIHQQLLLLYTPHLGNDEDHPPSPAHFSRALGKPSEKEVSAVEPAEKDWN